uniref:Uncharacterized protein n=1 Tax=Anguilla anguilla TaxID=7936 RepID=A0A0E9WKN3_ANGAN
MGSGDWCLLTVHCCKNAIVESPEKFLFSSSTSSSSSCVC